MMERMSGLSIEMLSHPGETLQEVLESKNMTQKELAARTDLSTKHINQIISGVAGISSEVAFKLEKVFNLSASFWMSLQAKYDAEKMQILEESSILEEEKDEFPCEVYNQLCKYGYLEKKKTITDKILQMRNFINVTNLLNVHNLVNSAACYRKSLNLKTDHYALASWLKVCELETNNININNNLDTFKLKNSISEIKSLIINDDLNLIINELKRIFADCGVAFAVVRNIKGAPVNGMIKRINNKLRMCVTFRNAYADIFWFTLFHEIGHLLDVDDSIFIDYTHTKTKEETIADKYARNTLITPSDYEYFLNHYNITKDNVLKYATHLNILPSILVGRLQYDGYLSRKYYNDLKIQYKWVEQ